MLGAIAGDIIGSIYEHNNIKTTQFPLFSPKSRFTDDTVLTVATADCILHGKDYGKAYQEYYRRYPSAGYGGRFARWAQSGNLAPYNSWGNGSAMRVSPVGFAFSSIDEVLLHAKKSAEVTHNHPEGIKGAQATAAAVFLARTQKDKAVIKSYIENVFGYPLEDSIDNIRKWYGFDVSCQGSVPQAIIAFLESVDFEDAVRKAVSIGGDSDTIACIAGAIAEAYYGRVPTSIKDQVLMRLDDKMVGIVEKFYKAFL